MHSVVAMGEVVMAQALVSLKASPCQPPQPFCCRALPKMTVGNRRGFFYVFGFVLFVTFASLQKSSSYVLEQSRTEA